MISSPGSWKFMASQLNHDLTGKFRQMQFGTMEKSEMYEKGVGVSNWGRWREVEFLETYQLQEDFFFPQVVEPHPEGLAYLSCKSHVQFPSYLQHLFHQRFLALLCHLMNNLSGSFVTKGGGCVQAGQESHFFITKS